MGLKKGPWSPEEDQVLVSFIQKNGHANWRALPQQAGLLRCGKSCRLRWINYLRPDIKRGNFSKEEEETITNLHEMIGNRWSAIAARLPGRTDNEIKNVWHTQLKKRLKNHESSRDSKRRRSDTKVAEDTDSDPVKENVSTSAQQCTSEMSSVTDSFTGKEKTVLIKDEEIVYSSEYFPRIGECFWSEELSVDERFDDSMSFWLNRLCRDGNVQDKPEF